MKKRDFFLIIFHRTDKRKRDGVYSEVVVLKLVYNFALGIISLSLISSVKNDKKKIAFFHGFLRVFTYSAQLIRDNEMMFMADL